MDQSVAIQETLAEDEKCVVAVQCLVLVSNTTESRLLGLVEHTNEHALFLFAHRRMAITGEDVTLDGIIPIWNHSHLGFGLRRLEGFLYES